MQHNKRTSLVEIRDVKKSFSNRKDPQMLVLDKLNFDIYENEIIALLGKSGSGKSTLLRIIAGLIQPSSGTVFYKGNKIHGPTQGISMVFQHFALMPWLTVLENVQLGLEAQGIPKEERRTKALKAIDIIGMDGFESAYPKELSGGMSQRIGFARALVVNPELLLMDEPFSALDVLTADNLRNELIDLWASKVTNIKSILCVTHNIEEAAILADRVLIFDSHPGTIKSILTIDLPHPRKEQGKRYREIVDDIYTLMTSKSKDQITQRRLPEKMIGLTYRLPKVAISELLGFMEALDSPEYQKRADLPEVADELNLNINDLLPITDALEILRFAKVSQGDIELTAAGKLLVEADILARKKVFADHLMRYVPLARHIRHVLDERKDHCASEERFLRELEDDLSTEAAEEVLTTVIDWGRYAEIFAYDYNTEQLSLENPE